MDRLNQVMSQIGSSGGGAPERAPQIGLREIQRDGDWVARMRRKDLEYVERGDGVRRERHSRPVRDPTPLWCWSLVTRADDDRPTVLALRENAEKLTRAAGLHVLPNRASWVPPQDPHRDTIAALRGS